MRPRILSPCSDPTARADAEPCTPSVIGECRGTCFTLSDVTGDRGMCGSLINYAVTPTCPDDPDYITPLRPANHNLGICIYRACWGDDDCTAPLVCRYVINNYPRFCYYAP